MLSIIGTGLLVLLQCFRGGTCRFVMFRQKYFYSLLLFWLFIFSIISFVFSLQKFISHHGWRCIPVSVKPDLGELISTLLKSKAGSTAKTYKEEILRFIDYCNFYRVPQAPPFTVMVFSC